MLDYKTAGVDIEAGYKSVELMKKHVKETMRPEVLGGLGGFAGAFDLSGIKNMEEPVLLSGTDGCGTKVKLAFVMDKHDTIGIDAVAMCVNDIACSGIGVPHAADTLVMRPGHGRVGLAGGFSGAAQVQDLPQVKAFQLGTVSGALQRIQAAAAVQQPAAHMAAIGSAVASQLAEIAGALKNDLGSRRCNRQHSDPPFCVLLLL